MRLWSNMELSVYRIFVLLYLGGVPFIEAEKLLVLPLDGSHWLSMRILVENLGQRGNQVVVLAPHSNIYIHPSENYILRTYPVPYSKQLLKEQMVKSANSVFAKRPLLEKITNMYQRITNITDILFSACQHLLYSKEIMQELRESAFDAALIDPFFPCGMIVAEYLRLPSLYLLYGLPCGIDFLATQCPSPISYVPRHFTGYSDLMSFPQRLKNALVWSVDSLICNFLYSPYARLASEFLHKEITILQLYSQTSIWLMRTDFVFDYPRPLMPNMVLVGGINCIGRKHLSQEFEKLVNSSGEHGFVVFSLGSMVSEIPINKATDIAEALKSIPQQVLWRYTGKTPPNLGENTHLVKWLPQNDLLAHPKARAFITHAGSHGIYEGICNAVPMVMLPLFGDQMDNAKRIESRGAGLTLNVLHMTSEDLSNAVKAVINNPVYKENIQRLSSLHLDRPVHPLDLAVHWVEFVMRHKGAPHLRPAAHDLNWFQYYSLDVIGFLMFFLLTTLFISLKCCTFVFRRCCKRSSKQKPKSKSQ
ncbi:UDP-glucuronosyltransferase 1A1 isoform X1 [Xenopus laevis]|nr:UDP-glucuronosyltransferase 1A1 isoform X1 [Xenopus laevis]